MDSLYTSADLYDLIHLGPWKGELEFYLRHAGQGRVLELACGTGRLTLPLAQHGVNITGIDYSDAMLERARSKAAQAGLNLEFARADMRDFHLGRRFDLIFIPINSICHLLTRADVEACFRCVHEHLAPEGRFVIDVFNPSLPILSRDVARWYDVSEYTDPEGQRVRLTEQNRYDSATQINRITWRFEWDDGRRMERDLQMKQYFPQELDALLAYNGFTVESKFGKYGGMEFHGESTQQLVVAKAA